MKKYWVWVLGFMFVLAGLGAAVTSAQNSGPGSSTSGSGIGGPMIVNINPNGKVLLRGKVVSVGTDSLVIKSWGGSWEVNVLPTTQIISVNKMLSDFKADDFAGVLGTVLADGSFEIDARILRQWGQKLDDDGDGIPNNQDEDDDNDGEENHRDQKVRDHDDDGIVDALDPDDDNDGILDVNEANKGHDHDNDGVSDSKDDDDDNDDIEDDEDEDDDDHDNDGVSDKDDDDDDNSGPGGGN